ncbi:N-acetylmuramoyl-L-alanine amidase family protein [Holophaga foetida]|uniref:N-acetylmuramoyl-L-alanine amidase family protein n=1 Tax=Holophaga foetida TaxID=35839 RepID=UPI0002473372|nr:N-acetylmuramoyl-L-alanine amidase [Holophaga foetida]
MKLPGILFTLLTSLLAWSQTPKLPSHPQRLKIALDPGHGGEDGGAIGVKKLQEKEASLDLALALAQALETAGFEVLLTRKEDTFVPLWERAQKANDAGADLFLSLHFNAARSKGARGSEVYFLSLDQGDADAAEVAKLENAGGDRNPETQDVVAGILDDLAQKAFLQDSERLAVAIQTQLNQIGNIKQRGVKQAPFAVLRRAAMPAALVEAAFISNPKEEAKLRDPAFRKRVAEAVTQGVRRFFANGLPTSRRKAILGPR